MLLGRRIQYAKIPGVVSAFSGYAGGKVLNPTYTAAGNFTRLQAGPLASRGAANQACTAVKAAGSACFPVAP